MKQTLEGSPLEIQSRSKTTLQRAVALVHDRQVMWPMLKRVLQLKRLLGDSANPEDRDLVHAGAVESYLAFSARFSVELINIVGLEKKHGNSTDGEMGQTINNTIDITVDPNKYLNSQYDTLIHLKAHVVCKLSDLCQGEPEYQDELNKLSKLNRALIVNKKLRLSPSPDEDLI